MRQHERQSPRRKARILKTARRLERVAKTVDEHDAARAALRGRGPIFSERRIQDKWLAFAGAVIASRGVR